MAIYPTKGVDAACMEAQNGWLQQQRVTYGAEDAKKTEEEDAEGGMRMAEAAWAERPKGWRLTLTLRVLGKGFPSDPVEQHAEMLRLQEEIVNALWNQMRIEAWQKEPIDPMSLTHLTPNAVDAVQFHLGTMNRWEDAMPIRATKCGDVPSVKNDPNERGVWLEVKIRQQPGAEPTLMRLKVEGGRDAQVEIERAHLCGANLVEDHAPLAPCPGRMYSEILGKMNAGDGSKMMFREFYERTCDEADADGGPGGSTTVCIYSDEVPPRGGGGHLAAVPEREGVQPEPDVWRTRPRHRQGSDEGDGTATPAHVRDQSGRLPPGGPGAHQESGSRQTGETRRGSVEDGTDDGPRAAVERRQRGEPGMGQRQRVGQKPNRKGRKRRQRL